MSGKQSATLFLLHTYIFKMTLMDREAWRAAVHGVTKSQTNGVQHNVISWMSPSKTSCSMVYLQDSGYGKDSIQFFDKLQIYCRDTVIRVFRISKTFLFRDLNLILCFPELCYAVFLCISGNLLSIQAFNLLSIKWLSFSSWTVYGGKFIEDKDSWYYPWGQSNFKDSQFISDNCSIKCYSLWTMPLP